MNDYERIANVIHYLDESYPQHPSLEEIAARAGLSMAHFHRLFSRWAGITPKGFLQCLTAADVRRRLKAGESVLTTALDAGLSGPGRLHDLCVNLEAASPGEIKSGGAGWAIRFGFAPTPFGEVLLAEGPRGICHLSFVEERRREQAELQQVWSSATFHRDDTHAQQCAENIFKPSSQPNSKRPLKACVRGTPFQVRVWRALLEVGVGEIMSYGALAGAMGKPGAARAVGTAIAQNKLAYLIPCHRVIRETGVVGNYRWGRVRKKAMLAWECNM